MTKANSNTSFTDMERVSSASHVLADLVQQMYYNRDSSGLNVVIKDLNAIINRARDCLDCLKILHDDRAMKSKLWLLVDYMEHNGISEDFVSELEDCTEYAQESFANSPELTMTADEERAMMKRLNAVIDREDQAANA